LEAGELSLIREIQQNYSSKELELLKQNPGQIIDGLILDDKTNLILSRSRQYQPNSDNLSPLQKDLIFIPYNTGNPNSPAVNPALELLMRQSHSNTGHGSATATVVDFRTRYWCAKAKKVASWVRKKCPVCSKLDSKPYKAPEIALPAFRCSGNKPFNAIGVDFVGPFSSIKETKKPVSILVLSCALTRAILLKPVIGQGMEKFKSVFNTVLNNYNLQPTIVVSDRAKTFQNCWKSTLYKHRHDLNLAYKQTGLEWHFNASRAPWWGGFYERFMHMIKDKMARTFQGTEFETMAAFEEAISFVQLAINSRPLTWNSADRDEPRPITPEMFLFLHSKYHMEGPLDYFCQVPQFEAGSASDLKAIIRRRRQTFKALWTLFQDTYISELRKRRQTKEVANDHLLEVGQVVLYKPTGIFKDHTAISRLKWKLARIEKLHPGRDGRIRSVDLSLFSHKTGQTYILESQTIHHIAPLEAELTEAERRLGATTEKME
jgi:hypothetical protein